MLVFSNWALQLSKLSSSKLLSDSNSELKFKSFSFSSNSVIEVVRECAFFFKVEGDFFGVGGHALGV